MDNIPINELNKLTDTIEITQIKGKGFGIKAKKNFYAGEIITLYALSELNKDEKPIKNGMYLYWIKCEDNLYYRYDVDLTKINTIKNSLTYFGHYVNEPSLIKNYNCCVKFYCPSKQQPYRHSMYYPFVIPMNSIEMAIVSIKPIKKNEEITIYYGENYQRDYVFSIK